MAEVYVPETPHDLLRLAQGYATPDAVEPSIKPLSPGLQSYIRATADLGPQSHIRHAVANNEIPVLPGSLQTEAYARRTIAHFTSEQDRIDLGVSVRMGHARQVLNSEAYIEYLAPDSVLLSFEHLGNTVLREALGAVLEILDTRPSDRTSFQLYPSKRVAQGAGGMILIYPEGIGVPEMTRGFTNKGGPSQQITGRELEELEGQFFDLQAVAYPPDTSRNMVEAVYADLAHRQDLP